jgi:hypothetical protein
MNDYLACQVQQINRAKTFADIRRIEDRANEMAQAAPGARRGSAWLRRTLGAARVRSHRAALLLSAASRTGEA